MVAVFLSRNRGTHAAEANFGNDCVFAAVRLQLGAEQMLVSIGECESSSCRVHFTASFMAISSLKKTLAVISMLHQHRGAMIAAFFSD